ncbi:MAG: aminopeptidase [Firmicutes bacterium]|nr:aminopeptidase [Bacillota bacterium]
MLDPRVSKLADLLVGYSCSVKKGERVLIEAVLVDYQIVTELVKAVKKAGGHPYVNIVDPKITREIIKNGDKEQFETLADFELYRMKGMDAYIGIRGGTNSFEMSDVCPEKIQLYTQIIKPVLDERVNNTKWVVLRWPTPSMAQLAHTSTENFTNFYFDVCTLDYKKMAKAAKNLEKAMDKADKVHIKAFDPCGTLHTDLTFSMKGIGVEICAGEKNIPDGEVFSAPVLDSVEGFITYNTPSLNNGISFDRVRLEFLKGKIVKATANNNQAELDKIFDTDEGARYIGEFAIGINPYITKPMNDILFDEKITGSIHFTPGSSYEDAGNGNKSAIHWDLVQIHTKEYGGGEIWFDGKLIRKDGRFVVKELEGLNPENLM